MNTNYNRKPEARSQEFGKNPDLLPSSVSRLQTSDPSHSRGFTLIEIIVSLAIFSVVATIALGALIKIVDANRKAQTLQSAITNLNFALESISREMRVGTKYYCDSGTNVSVNTITAPLACNITGVEGGQGGYIAFNSAKSDTSNPSSPCNLIIAYRFKPAEVGFVLEKAQQQRCGQAIGDSLFAPVVDPNVFVTSYYLRVVNNTFPLGMVKVSGYAGVREKDRTYFDVQSAISARVP